MKIMKQILVFTLVAVIAFASVGCSSKETNETDTKTPATTKENKEVKETAEAEEVLIKFPHYRTGPSGEGVTFGAQVERFNEKFKGTYRIELEEIPGEQYNDKIKLLYQSGKLPALFETNNSDPEWTKTLMDNNAWLDLAPYIEADPEFKAVMMEDSLAFNTREDGAIPSLPYAYVKYAYMFYNKEIFTNAGVNEVPADWDAFIAACEQIKASGVTPISFMTGENAWTTMLMS
ncbi:ABC transporter substrate-binding protein, partial [Vallitalea okinawensis]|uniref:ABC transporter substrate-binding protein n=1 Tax=Vallitalea okinawensis TaxID=2078660 RepID=UPI0013003BFB